jgi:PPE-repeat protein
MLAAAEAWETTAAELYSAANSYQSVVSGLTAGPWLGPSSVTMASAASSYAAWLSRTAAQADQTAGQALAAVAAYEGAFAATVPPPEIAANRSLLMSLVATNLLGQNTSAIAATEAQYGEMWAQDTGAMYGYAASAASATHVTPFTAPQQNTNPGGLASQASAEATHSTASQTSQTLSSVPAQLSNFLSGGTTNSLTPLDILGVGADGVAYGLDAPLSPLSAVSLPIDLIGAQTGLHTDDIVSGWSEGGPAPETVVATPNVVSTTVSAGLGEAKPIGALSVPPTWAAATPAVRPIALALPATSIGIDEQAMTNGMGDMFGEMTLANAAARAVGDTVGRRGREARKPAAAGGQAVSAEAATAAGEDAAAESEPRTVVTGIAAEIRDFARLRDEGLISDEDYTQQRNRLLGR